MEVATLCFVEHVGVLPSVNLDRGMRAFLSERD
jgi:hypothetical protein